MELKRLSDELTVCKVKSMNDINLDAEFFFIAFSLVILKSQGYVQYMAETGSQR